MYLFMYVYAYVYVDVDVDVYVQLAESWPYVCTLGPRVGGILA